MHKKMYLFSFATALWLALSAFYSGPIKAPSRMTLSSSGGLSEFHPVPPPPCIGLSTENGDFPAGQMTQWTVPAGVTEVEVIAIGGDGSNDGAVGGSGAIAHATLPVNAGDVLNIIVAGTATNGGGGGGTGIYNATTGEVLIVAGGGGGAGAFSINGQGGRATENGGSTGGPSGGTNGSGGEQGAASGGGGAFSPGGSFVGGGGGQGVPDGGNGGVYNGSSGAFGFGGGGAGFPYGNSGDGGGGGGYSGGGGAATGTNNPGGGGGSFVHASGTGVTISDGTDGGGSNGSGSLFLCYTIQPPCDIAIDNVNTTDENCPGADDGSLTVSASCTTCSGINYSIDGVNFQAGSTFNGLAPGPYTVTVRDTGDPGCEATDNATVNGGPTTDSDSDGTPDCSDGCPNDPGKTAPGACGCGVADTDTDSDGIADCDDNCPATANPGQEDADSDGYGDACDQCPTDPDKYEAGICGCFFPETSCIDACAVFNSFVDNVMEDDTDLNNGQQNALVTKLHHAKLNLEEGDNTTAINQLNAFINQVEGLSGGNNSKIPAAIADEWIAIAQNIISHINSGTAYCIQPLIAAPGQITAAQAGQGLESSTNNLNAASGHAGAQEPGGGSPAHAGKAIRTMKPVQLEAFPNPFTQQTTLQYYLPADGRVQMSILSIHGQEVAKIVNCLQAAGQQQVEWKNDAGLPAGVYFARLQTDSGVSTLQLVLAR